MPHCPRCQSNRVYLSKSQDSLLYRLLLLARVRCHSCCASFFAAAWKVGPPTEPSTNSSGSSKRQQAA